MLKGDNSVGEFYSVALTNNYQQVLHPSPLMKHSDHFYNYVSDWCVGLMLSTYVWKCAAKV